MGKYALPFMLIMLAIRFAGGYLASELTKTDGAWQDAADEKPPLTEAVIGQSGEKDHKKDATNRAGAGAAAMPTGGEAAADDLQREIAVLREQAAQREHEMLQLRADLEKAQAGAANGLGDASPKFDLTDLRAKQEVMSAAVYKAFEPYSKLEPAKQTLKEYLRVSNEMQKTHSIESMEWFLDFIAMVKDTRERSPRLFFDERFLPDILVLLYESPLGLTKQQTDTLREVAVILARKYAGELDTTAVLASVVYKARRDLEIDLCAMLLPVLNIPQMEKFQALQLFFSLYLRGSTTTYGLGVFTAQQGEDKIVAKYTEVYGLDEVQQDTLKTILANSRAAERMIDVMAENGYFEANAPSPLDQPLPKEGWVRFKLLELQVELIDIPLSDVLTAEQIKRVVGSAQLIRFIYGENNSFYDNNGMGY